MSEGELIAAFLMLAYGVCAKRSIALGVTSLAVNSIYLTINHILFLGGIPWNIAIFHGLIFYIKPCEAANFVYSNPKRELHSCESDWTTG